MLRSEKTVFPQFKVFRLTVLQTRKELLTESIRTDHNSKAFTYKVDSFYTFNGTLSRVSASGLLIDGKEVLTPNSVFHDGRSIYLSFPHPVEWNGWYIVTSCFGDSTLDPVRFVMDACDGAAWVPVGSSSYVRTYLGSSLFHAPYSTPIARCHHVAFDLARYFPGSLSFSVAMELGLVACGAAGHEELGTSVLQAKNSPMQYKH